MKKITFLMMLFLCVVTGYGQTSIYSRTELSGLTYTPIAGGTVINTVEGLSSGMSTNSDDGAVVVNLPFTFVYNGLPYTQATFCTNGWVGMGDQMTVGALNSRTASNLFNTTEPHNILAAWYADGGANFPYGTTTAGIGSLVHGSIGADIYAFEWKDVVSNGFTNNNGTNVMNYMIVIYGPASPSPGRIEFLYGSTTGTVSGSRAIGINNAPGGTGHYLNAVNGLSNSTITSSAWPGNGNGYRFDPPLPCDGIPVAGTVSTNLNRFLCTGVASGIITVTDASLSAPGISYQWEQKLVIDSSWMDVTEGTGANTLSYTPPVFAGTDIQYRLKVTCSNSNETVYSDITTISNKSVPATQISNLVLSNTPTAVTVNWVNGDGDRRVVIVSDSPIIDPENGIQAITAVAAFANAGQQVVYDNTGATVTVTGLTCGTTYYVKVYEVNRCGSTGSFNYFFNTTGTANATTVTGGPSTAALTVANNFTGFTGANLSTVFPGWYEATLTTAAGTNPENTNPVVANSQWLSPPVVATTALEMATAKVNQYTATRNEWIISPKMQIAADSRVVFKAAITAYNNGNPHTNGTANNPDDDGMQGTDDKVNILISTDGCGATWTPIYTFEASNTSSLTNVLTEFIIPIPSTYNGQAIQIAFQATTGPVNESRDYDFHIGDIKIEVAPQCDYVSVNSVENVTKNSATISWGTPATGTPTGYEYVISTTNTPPTAAGTATTTTSADITTGLTPSTEYYVFVRTVCGTSFSEWSLPPVTFTTLCDYPEILTASATSVCGVGASTLTATSTGGDIKWYTAQTAGTEIGTGASIDSPIIAETTSFWVEASISGGPDGSTAKPAPGGTSTYNDVDTGIVFNVTEQTGLKTVSLYSNNDGTVNIKITNNAGVEIFETGIVSINGGNVENIVPLNYVIAPGTAYRMLIKSHSGVSLVRDSSGNSFPYNGTGDVVNVTSSWAFGSTSTSYYYFYNLKYSNKCSSVRTEVIATVTTAPAITAVASEATICLGESTTLSVTSDNAGYTYVWMPGNLEGATQTVSPTENTVYTVTATDLTTNCSIIQDVTVTLNPISSINIPSTSLTACEDSILTLTAGLENNLLNESFDSASNSFATASTSGTASATLETNHYTEGTGAILFKTTSTNANLSYAMTSSVDLSSFTSAKLNFSHIVGMEGNTYSYDLGYVEYSTDGGSTWATFPSSSYEGNGTLITMQGTSNPITGVVFSTRSYTDWNSQFTGTTSVPGANSASLWKTETINIPEAALTNQFKLRFRITTDGSSNYYGWLIDNLSIFSTTPGVIWSPSTGLFTDEAGTVAYAGETAGTVYAKAVATTTYTATATSSATGCSATTTVDITVTPAPDAPTGLAMQTVEVEPGDDATLADLDATGDDVKWYASADDAADGVNELPLTTTVVDGTVYYATQTVGTCASPSLAVTVSVVLGKDSFDMGSFRYYPNPVKDVLTISYNKNITSVSVYNLLGQQVLFKDINAAEAQLNLSQLAEGAYIVNVKSDNAVKSIKVIKK